MKHQNIISLISHVRNLANEFIVEELRKEGIEDISPSHGNIMNALFFQDGLSMKEINEKINKKKNTVTVLIDKLENLGYVTKKTDADDKRITHIYLTEKGRSFEKSFRSVSAKLIKKTFEGFSEKERMVVVKLLDKIRRNFE